jgi:surface polysaccharide O-acyltransferase-like enzyme
MSVEAKHAAAAANPHAPRDLTLDFLRVLAAFFVIMLHTSSGVVTTNPDIQSVTWWTGNLFDSYSRWCVPVFVMISGTLLPRLQIRRLPFYPNA